MMRKIIPIVSIMLMMSLAVNSAVIECNWSGETCSPKTGTPITQPYEVITITGKPTNYINTVTTYIGIIIARYIPASLFTIFTNLKSIWMINCGLSNLAANLSMNCPVLEKLTIDEGPLQEVPEGFLQTCSNVTMIGFRHNQITTVDKNAFRGLAKLQQLDMMNNRITCLHPDLFQHTPALSSGHFTFNRISALDRNLFRNLKSIGLFDIRYNSLTYWPVLNLSSPATTYSIAFYAYGNPIYAINPNFCTTFTSRPSQSFDNINVKGIPCLPNNTLLFRFDKQNCQTSASVLQSCYANWTPSMSDNVICGQGSGVCITSNILSKLAEFVKYLPV